MMNIVVANAMTVLPSNVVVHGASNKAMMPETAEMMIINENGDWVRVLLSLEDCTPVAIACQVTDDVRMCNEVVVLPTNVAQELYDKWIKDTTTMYDLYLTGEDVYMQFSVLDMPAYEEVSV